MFRQIFKFKYLNSNICKKIIITTSIGGGLLGGIFTTYMTINNKHILKVTINENTPKLNFYYSKIKKENILVGINDITLGILYGVVIGGMSPILLIAGGFYGTGLGIKKFIKVK